MRLSLAARPALLVSLALVGACSSLECPAGYVQVANRCIERAASPSPAAAIHTSAGGGTAKSDRYAVRLSVGTPAPMGDAKSESYRLQAGPKGDRP